MSLAASNLSSSLLLWSMNTLKPLPKSVSLFQEEEARKKSRDSGSRRADVKGRELPQVPLASGRASRGGMCEGERGHASRCATPAVALAVGPSRPPLGSRPSVPAAVRLTDKEAKCSATWLRPTPRTQHGCGGIWFVAVGPQGAFVCYCVRKRTVLRKYDFSSWISTNVFNTSAWSHDFML